MFRYDATNVLGSISVPTLVFTGHLDRLIVPETARFITAHVGSAHLTRLEPAGHMPVFERHDRLVPELQAFAADVLTARPDAARAGGGN
jgi:pimeloyl-ACP methyl ester carboxylesterase